MLDDELNQHVGFVSTSLKDNEPHFHACIQRNQGNKKRQTFSLQKIKRCAFGN
jgi:hypothetical protein